MIDFFRDFREFLAAMQRADAKFLVVGAHALAAHGVPRATVDLDVWVECSVENAARVKNKRASGRHKDLGDVESLGETP